MKVFKSITAQISMMFIYSSKSPAYVLLKTLCLIIGLPLYISFVVVDIALTLVYLLISWIPLVNAIFKFICDVFSYIFVTGSFLVCILTDVKDYFAALDNTKKLNE